MYEIGNAENDVTVNHCRGGGRRNSSRQTTMYTYRYRVATNDKFQNKRQYEYRERKLYCRARMFGVWTLRRRTILLRSANSARVPKNTRRAKN